ncbi:FxSxx-COOH system tetratricopeptide repeat protein [Actinocorallia sp. B10E7]|uniref:FxSxx-COOH system tetratricopeptide repeat protein n=1 Tax=Actinocorallia sp. B10E7 TaxID=3153558 RepID=UPI00325E62C2
MTYAAASGDRSIAAGSLSGTAISGDYNRVYRFDAALPDVRDVTPDSVWNVRLRPSQVFVGRQDALRELSDVMSTGAGLVGQTVAGLGGVGKTELALHYAFRNRNRYRSIWWITADSAENITKGLIGIAAILNPTLRSVDPDFARQWALNWLMFHRDWLLVLDNVEDPDAVTEFLGADHGGRVLVTTRRDVDWIRRGLRPVRLETLGLDAAIDLLVERTGQKGPRDRSAARLIADALGRLPLALEQAAAYISCTGETLSDYADRLARRFDDLLSEVAPDVAQERAITRTWNITLDALTARDPRAVDLLHVMAWLGPDHLPRDLVIAHLGGDEIGANRLLSLLRSYSMITVTKTTVSLHRLVQAVLRLGERDEPLMETGLTSAGAAAVSLLAAAVPPDPISDMTGWPRWWDLLPHVDALADHVGDGSSDGPFCLLLNQAGLFASAQGLYPVASKFCELALSIGVKTLTSGDADLSTLQGNLGVAYHALGRHQDAEDLERDSLAVLKRVSAPDDIALVIPMVNLASTLSSLGRNDQAVDLQTRALAIAEGSPDAPDDLRAWVLGNLASLYRLLGQATEAVGHQERALALIRAARGDEHISVASHTTDLASIYRDLYRLDEALTLAEEALTVAERTLRPDNPDLARFVGEVALCHAALENHERRLQLELRATRIVEDAPLEPDHPTLGARAQQLASAYRELDRLDEALDVAQRGLRIAETAFGPDHQNAAYHLNTLASIHRRRGELDLALRAGRRAQAIIERVYEFPHPDVADMLGGVAQTLVEQGRHAEAAPKFRRAYEIVRQLNGRFHPEVEGYASQLATTYEKLDAPRLDDAVTFRTIALEGAEHRHGPASLEVVSRLTDLAWTHCLRGDEERAVPLLERAQRIAEAADPDDLKLLLCLDVLARCHVELGRYEAALPLRKRTLAIAESRFGRDDPRTADSLGALGTVFYRLGRYAAAAPLEERALALTQEAGDGHPDLPLRLSNLAATYLELGRRLEAAPLLAHEIVLRETSGDEADLLPLLDKIIDVHYETEDHALEAEYRQRAYEIVRKKHGTDDHPDVIWRLSGLGHCHFMMFQFEESAAFERRALASGERVFGVEHPSLLLLLQNLAVSLVRLDDEAGSLLLRLRSLALLENARSADPTEERADAVVDELFCVLDVLSGMSELLSGPGAAHARSLAERAREVAGRLLPSHPAAERIRDALDLPEHPDLRIS